MAPTTRHTTPPRWERSRRGGVFLGRGPQASAKIAPDLIVLEARHITTTRLTSRLVRGAGSTPVEHDAEGQIPRVQFRPVPVYLTPDAMRQVEHECPGVSREMIQHALRDLRDKGRVRSEGTGRGARRVKTGE